MPKVEHHPTQCPMSGHDKCIYVYIIYIHVYIYIVILIYMHVCMCKYIKEIEMIEQLSGADSAA